MKIIRLLIYSGTPERLVQQLANSLPDGVRDCGRDLKITALTLGDLSELVDIQLKDEDEGGDDA